MNKGKTICFLAAVSLMAVVAVLLMQMHTHQKLGLPGVRTHPLADSIRLVADLPEKVLDYRSEQQETDAETVSTLPADTSFGQRLYTAPDGFQLDLKIVLMGTDRTSLHKPQFCLPGQGWQINNTLSGQTSIPIERPCAYNLPVVKLIASTERVINGENIRASGVYVYWYVCDDGLSATVSGYERMWLMTKRLLTTGILQRWAYVSCWSACPPGREEATFQRMRAFIAAAAPDFQLIPKVPLAAVTARK